MKRAMLATAIVLASALAGAFVQHYCDALLVANILHSSSMSISENVEQAAAYMDMFFRVIQTSDVPATASGQDLYCGSATDDAE